VSLQNPARRGEEPGRVPHRLGRQIRRSARMPWLLPARSSHPGNRGRRHGRRRRSADLVAALVRRCRVVDGDLLGSGGCQPPDNIPFSVSVIPIWIEHADLERAPRPFRSGRIPLSLWQKGTGPSGSVPFFVVIFAYSSLRVYM
jgi:hypothetical protein